MEGKSVMGTQITWENFEAFNQDAQGIRFKFEDLCRQLFQKHFLRDPYVILHASPNNAGLETEPAFDDRTHRWIGFQCKYFDKKVDYTQIKGSAQTIISEKKNPNDPNSKVQHVYLFSNFPIDSKVKTFVDTKNMLARAGISLELVTDNAILDLVRQYDYLGTYYFGNHSIDIEYLKKLLRQVLDAIGDRYNQKFNIVTNVEDELSLFIRDVKGFDLLNQKKVSLKQRCEELKRRDHQHEAYLNAIIKGISQMPDVFEDNYRESYEWKSQIISVTYPFLERLNAELSKLTSEKGQLADQLNNEATNAGAKESVNVNEEYNRVNFKIENLKGLLKLPDLLEVTGHEKALLEGSALSVLGKAGVGKTQLCAHKASTLLFHDNRCAVFLVGSMFLGEENIQKQFMDNLGQNYSFEEFLDILETIGEKYHYTVPVFIDALNESWKLQLWKSCLIQIIDKVSSRPMVKLVVTFRTEYQSSLVPESITNGTASNKMIMIHHDGFAQRSIEAIQTFLNQYNIPFTPADYFNQEMNNPLFLTLYCRTYNGEEIGLSELYDRLLQQANCDIWKQLEKVLSEKGFIEGDDVLTKLILEIATAQFENGKKSLSQTEISALPYWSDYDIAPKILLLKLEKEGVLIEDAYDSERRFSFAYDQMNDYFYAKAVMKKYGTKESLQRYVITEVLALHDGRVGNLSNIDLFTHICALYAKRYHEELADIIDTVTDESSQEYLIDAYLVSFELRERDSIDTVRFLSFLNTHPVPVDDLWKMLISNSVKVSNPLNAEFLHRLLTKYSISRRDYFWTIPINDLSLDEKNRFVALVKLYEKGSKLEFRNSKQVELLLILMTWVLTTSNRWLRDHTSKAMIEILRDRFDLCVKLLKKFEDVNDPYVLQRLYGIVLGACLKRSKDYVGEYETLVEYIYKHVFDAELVYPDILLRDYARQIIERFIVEYPERTDCVVVSRIKPPYKSEPIPIVRPIDLKEDENTSGRFGILDSMRFEGMGMYGDFGRYVYQNALRYFKVDEKNIFNYSLSYIFNELGYDENLFGEYDSRCIRYDRDNASKTERIGKKYQWITMYNVLARVSDHCEMNDDPSFPERKPQIYNGPWLPNVRDFDPTLNSNFIRVSVAPHFAYLEEFVKAAKDENISVKLEQEESINGWLQLEGTFIRDLNNTLMLKDKEGGWWVLLSEYIDTGRDQLKQSRLLTWSWLFGYLINAEQKDALIKLAAHHKNLVTDEISSDNVNYAVFNREFPWSASCESLRRNSWVEPGIEAIDAKTTEEVIEIPDLEAYGDFSKFNEADIPTKKMTIYHVEKQPLGQVLRASSTLLWEEEYDASKEDPISIDVPCYDIIEVMKLRQLNYDGCYFDEHQKMAAFDLKYTQNGSGVAIRKDLLDEYLKRTGKIMAWFVKGSKELRSNDLMIRKTVDWNGLYIYDGHQTAGQLYQVDS